MKYYRILGVFFLVFMALSLVFYTSVLYKTKQNTNLLIIQIEKQIALDLPYLDLSNQRLKHSGNNEIVLNYIEKLNKYLVKSNIEVISIKPQSEGNIALKEAQFSRRLNSNDGVVIIVFGITKIYLTASNMVFHLLFLILAILISLWVNCVFIVQSKSKLINTMDTTRLEAQSLHLIVNLNNKTLYVNDEEEDKVGLANKPLCFFLALVEYCTNNADESLHHSNHVPDELIELANKYFYRLIELGHTIRKRPNFNSSLEKTLSEIRAALDEVLNEYPDMKEIYYPPKAYGEGSRSRLHSYALTNIAKGNIEIIGK